MIKEKILNIRNNHTQNLHTLAKYIRDTRLLGFCVKWNVLAVQQIRNHIMFSGTQNEREGFFCMNFNRTLLFQYKEDDVVHIKEIENQSFKKDLEEIYADLKYLNLLSENDCDEVYEKIGSITCIEEAFKLDTLGQNPNEVERCYRAELTANPKNLLCHNRLVTFLITRARHADALTAFQQALDSAPQVLTFWHLTMPVVQAWLAVGEVGYARKAFNTVQRSQEIDASGGDLRGEFTRIEQQLMDMEEAERFGVAVYPSGVPIKQRWHAPRLAQKVHQQRNLVDWFPGCAMLGDVANTIFVTWVEDGASPNPRVLNSTYSVDEWKSLCGEIPSEKKLYIEFADYGDNIWVVFTDPQPVMNEVLDTTKEQLRYLLAEPHVDSVVG